MLIYINLHNIIGHSITLPTFSWIPVVFLCPVTCNMNVYTWCRLYISGLFINSKCQVYLQNCTETWKWTRPNVQFCLKCAVNLTQFQHANFQCVKVRITNFNLSRNSQIKRSIAKQRHLEACAKVWKIHIATAEDRTRLKRVKRVKRVTMRFAFGL